MRTEHLRLLALSLLLASLFTSGCGVTFGVDVTEISTELDMPADGVGRFELDHVGVNDEVVVEGGGERIAMHLDMLDWNHRPDRVRAELVAHGNVARVQMVSSESITLTSASVSIPETVETAIALSHGSLSLSNLSAPATVSAQSITLHNVAAPVVADASSVHFDYSVPLDLRTTGSVYGTTSAPGVVFTEKNAQITLRGASIAQFEIHSSSDDAEAGFIEVFLPPGAHYTVFVRTPGHAVVGAGDVDYDSLDEGAPSPSTGLTFEVGGGGPPLTFTATTASILVMGS